MNLIHGDARGSTYSAEYRAWQCMKRRCNSPSHRAWARYGSKGIKVCERWSDFQNFLSDMGRKPTPKHSLDRIDNDGDYCKENCRWATASEQQRNTRRSIFVTYNQITKHVCDWAKEFGIRADTLRSRLKRGWTPEKSFLTPLNTQKGGQ